MTLLFFVNKLLAVGTFVSQILLVLIFVSYVVFKKRNGALFLFLKKHGLLLAFLVALVSMLSSLFYSNVAGFAPCNLCWFQRIFMYPLVFLLGLALYKKDTNITGYGILLASVGLAISFYHNAMYYSNGGLISLCELAGKSGVSCIKRYVFELGYVTIPMMALTGFILVILLLFFSRRQNLGNDR